MTNSRSLVAWAGGALFVAALAVCAYAYLVVWARPSPFRPAAIAIDAALLAVFAAHHSLFARDPIKKRLARLVGIDRERSVYVWIASLLLIATCLGWRPVGGEIYHLQAGRAYVHAGLQSAGVCIIAWAVAAIDPLELAGIRPASTPDALQIGGPYRWVRHPLYFGWMLATFGAAHMTGDRLTFAVATAVYLAIAVPWEERSLLRQFGRAYADYRRQVRWRIVPYVY